MTEIFPDRGRISQRLRSVNWTRLGLTLNNGSLAAGLGLLIYYGLRFLDFSWVPSVEPGTERRYGLILFSVALAVNLLSYAAMWYGRFLSRGVRSYATGEGTFDYAKFEREKAAQRPVQARTAEAVVREAPKPYAMQSFPSFLAKDDEPEATDVPDPGEASEELSASEETPDGLSDEPGEAEPVAPEPVGEEASESTSGALPGDERKRYSSELEEAHARVAELRAKLAEIQARGE